MKKQLEMIPSRLGTCNGCVLKDTKNCKNKKCIIDKKCFIFVKKEENAK